MDRRQSVGEDKLGRRPSWWLGRAASKEGDCRVTCNPCDLRDGLSGQQGAEVIMMLQAFAVTVSLVLAALVADHG